MPLVGTENSSVFGRIPIAAAPSSVPISIAPHPNGRVVYVADRAGSRVAVVDTAGQTAIASVPTPGLAPRDLILHPDGRSLFVAANLNRSRGLSLLVVDTETNTISDSLPCCLFGGGGGSLEAINAIPALVVHPTGAFVSRRPMSR